MANNLIQIKRSLNTAIPASLANGELAFTANGDHLYIGSPNGSIIPIGGFYNYGVLTANQALVANSTSGIDKIIVANLQPTAIYANNSLGSAGQVLYSNGTAVYWSNNTGLAAGSGLASNATSLFVLANNGIVANSTGTFVTGGSTVTVNATGVHVNTANLTFATSQITTGNYVATITSGNGVTASVTSGTGSTPTLYAIAGAGAVVNASGINVLANNGIIANSTGVFVNAGSGLVTNSTGVHVGTANGIVVDADAIRVQAANGIAVNSGGVTVVGGPTLTVNATGVHVNSTLSLQDLTLSGNLTVTGTLTTIDTTNLIVEDSMIELANGNLTTDSLDIGFFGQYGATGTKYTGLFRDATDGLYKLYSGLTVEPTTTVDTSNASYTIATLQAYLNSGALVSNATNLALTANSTVNVAIVANNISWSGLAQNGIIYGGASGAFTNLSAGAGGTVLMISTAGVPEFATLDGGSF